MHAATPDICNRGIRSQQDGYCPENPRSFTADAMCVGVQTLPGNGHYIQMGASKAPALHLPERGPQGLVQPYPLGFFWLVLDENGQPVTQCALRSRFDKTRTLVDFQFRDIRAKAATDTGDLAHSQKLLAHKNRNMTEHYVKARMGERVKPLK